MWERWAAIIYCTLLKEVCMQKSERLMGCRKRISDDHEPDMRA